MQHFIDINKDGTTEKINQAIPNQEQNVSNGPTDSYKLTYNLNNPRSASFQPSVIRRRDGNKLQNVNLQEEMKMNIMNRRKGK